jgi:hypothetical protein
MTTEEAVFLTEAWKHRAAKAERQRDALLELVSKSYRNGYAAGLARAKQGGQARSTNRGRLPLHERVMQS